jgi:hypothetical protein
MTDETIEFLWLAQKDPRVSLMTVGSDKHVFHLQILIHEAGKKGVFRDNDARDLVLWMASTFENPALLLLLTLFDSSTNQNPLTHLILLLGT